MQIFKTYYDLGCIESCQVPREPSEFIEDFHEVSRFNKLYEHVHDALVLSHSLHLEDQGVVKATHDTYLVVQMTFLLTFHQLIFALKFHCKILL